MAVRSIFRSGNSLVIALPSHLLARLRLQEGTTVDVELAEDSRSISITPVEQPVISQDYAKKVDDFIERYRPALESLSKR